MRTSTPALPALLAAAALAALAACDTASGSNDGTGDPGDTPDTGMPGMDMPGTDDPPGDVEAPATCADFCALDLATCAGDNAQFPDAISCAAVCASWPAGTPGDLIGNTLACRASHIAEIASGGEDPADHCDHTGPGGGEMCGPLCAEFCFRVLAYCTGANQVFVSDADCQAACATFPANGSESDTTGDTVQCRIYHAGVARTSPAVHCPHTAADSPVCR